MTEYEHRLIMTTYCLALENQTLILALAAKLGVDLSKVAKDMQNARPENAL